MKVLIMKVFHNNESINNSDDKLINDFNHKYEYKKNDKKYFKQNVT